jgi:DNA-binding ferritin-like protein (Dps family)
MSEASYWEKFKYFYFGEEPEFEKTWIWASFVHGAVANYLIYKGGDVSIPTRWSDIGQWVDDNWSEWSSLDIYAGGLLDNTGGKAERYNDVLKKLYSDTRLGNQAYARHNAIKTPSFFIKMGYSNAKEYYAWGAFALAWAGTINKDQVLLNMASQYLDDYMKRPSDISSDLWRTPSSTDPKRMEAFGEKIDEFARSKFAMDIQPFIYGNDLSGVRAFCDRMIQDAKDTVMLAVETNGFKKQESIDWGKLAFGAIVVLGAINLIKR